MKSVYLELALVIFFAAPVFAAPTAPGEVRNRTGRDCLAGLPDDTPMSEIALMTLAFDARTIPSGQKCAGEMELPYDNTRISDAPQIFCQVCATAPMSETRLIGERTVNSVYNPEIGDVVFYFKNKNTNDYSLNMRCRSTSQAKTLQQLFKQKSSAKIFFERLKAWSGVTCSQPNLPPEATLRPGDGKQGPGTRIQ